MTIDISAIINFHDEGRLAQTSLLSAARARAFAERQGLHIETIAVLDRPDDETLKYLTGMEGLDQLLQVSHGDPALARNSGVHAARGEWIAFLDGDDMWGENWLAAAHAFAERDKRPIIMHPQVSLYFGEQSQLSIHVDMEDEDFDLLSLAMENYWTVLAFARRSTYAAIPFSPRDPACKIGFEDWSWNWETISHGFIHKSVPNTMHAVRMWKKSSVVRQDVTTKSLPAPTMLFRDVLSGRGFHGSTAPAPRHHGTSPLHAQIPLGQRIE